MLSIGEFSRATGITVKTLRFYHEKGLLVPDHIDADSSYRYYRKEKIDTAKVITTLRKLELPLREIESILLSYQADLDILSFLETHQKNLHQRLSDLQTASNSLEALIRIEKEQRNPMPTTDFTIQEKELPTQLIASITMRGKYSDCSKGFAKLGKYFWSQANGKPFMLYYDKEYKEDDAHFATCFPIKKGTSKDDIEVWELPAGKCLSLMHKGCYDTLRNSYEKIIPAVKERGNLVCPSREIYHKGPGMLFKGNPKNYLTEIQILFTETC
ncbi:MAG: MerR family transcriptional regulator [Pirellulaceae bacterium]|nr:MerR family transcriptional regulator [Pirellulaceae bacterium]